MKILSLTCLVLTGGCLLTGCADNPPPPPHRPATVIIERQPPPPALIVEVPPPRPRYAVIWVRGHWRWNGHRYVWVRGHYRPA